MPTLNETIDATRADYLRAKDQLAATFANIPDERVGWSPSPTARTPIEIVVHCANAVRYLQQQMSGIPFAIATTEEAQATFRAFERAFQTRAQATDFLDEVSAEYVAWLGERTDARLATPAQLPFGLGELPVGMWLDIPANHMRGHVAQLEYLQTIYGDEDWRINR